MADLHYTRLAASTDSFSKMMEGFGVVTVMNADIYACDVASIKGK